MSTPGGYPVEPSGTSEPSGAGPSGVPGWPGPAGAPEPPPGPGVTPPFAAPPTDRDRRGLWIGLGLGALVLVLCCVGGLAGFGLLAVSGTRQVQTQATEEVSGYLDAIEAADYDAAYSHLCSPMKRQVSRAEFAARQEDGPRLTSYVVHQPQVGNTIVVPADLRYQDGTSSLHRYRLRQESGSQELRICGGI
ncbi:hypothetical protein ACNTMW_22405 [Planosporangium sp. 12N6]|uniref:Rv0361 family membrane protein n=1 Tax=Planosporangium spinosum TaxID=3402278 RepID=UPI003CEB5078